MARPLAVTIGCQVCGWERSQHYTPNHWQARVWWLHRRFDLHYVRHALGY
jgi:hypothetical protein